MNIAVLIGRFPPVFGGQTPVEIEIHSELVNRGHNVSFLTPKYSDDLKDYELFKGINVYRIRPGMKGPLSELRYVFNSLYHLFKLELNPDVLIDCLPFGNSMLITYIASKIFKIPVISKMSQVGTNEPLSAKSGKLGFLRKSLFLFYEHNIAISPSLVENCNKGGVPIEKITLVSNCLDTNRFSNMKDSKKISLRKNLMDGFDGRIVIVVGNVSKRKRVHLAIESWNILKNKFSDPCKIVFIGPIESTGHEFDALYVKNIRKLVNQYKLNDSVIFTGNKKNIEQYYNIADVLLFVSEREGLGMVVLEAMSCEVPVVTVNIEKITDYILTNNLEGLIVKDKAKEIATSLINILSDQKLSEKMGKRGRKTVVEKFGVNIIVDQIEILYQNGVKNYKMKNNI